MVNGSFASRWIAGFLRPAKLVPERGLEPPRPCDHCDLNAARLPVPPLGHECEKDNSSVAGAASNETFSFCPARSPLSTQRRPTRPTLIGVCVAKGRVFLSFQAAHASEEGA